MNFEETFSFEIDDLHLGQYSPQISQSLVQPYSNEQFGLIENQKDKINRIDTYDDPLIPLPKDQSQQVDYQAPFIYFFEDSPTPSPFLKQEYKDVFIEQNYQRKNTNFAKFLVSNFTKQVKRKKNELTQLHLQYLQRAKQIYQRNGKRNIQIEALFLLFGQSKENASLTKKNRQILFHYLGSKLFKVNSIFKNVFISQKNIKQHLLASKVYKLRCYSKHLVSRTQTK